jgi:hypothetical protein
MKHIIATLFAVLVTAGVAFSQDRPVIAFTDTVHTFGQVPQGTPVTHVFQFTNTGDAPLIISAVDVSCGCTSPDWTKSPVLPGQSGFVSAQYNAASPGAFNKFVTVRSNATRAEHKLSFNGEVLPKVDQNGTTPVMPVTPNTNN